MYAGERLCACSRVPANVALATAAAAAGPQWVTAHLELTRPGEPHFAHVARVLARRNVLPAAGFERNVESVVGEWQADRRQAYRCRYRRGRLRVQR